MKIYSLMIATLLFFSGCCEIDPSKTVYKVYSVIDANGNKYDNLIPNGNGPYSKSFRSINGQQTYVFHGTYTVISSIISGNDIINNRLEKE